jgi:hypothetical protein
VSGAKWIAAEQPSWSSRLSWLHWRRKKAGDSNQQCIPVADAEFALIASFDDARKIGTAVTALRQAAFPAEDVAPVRSIVCASDGLWAKLCNWLSARFGRETQAEYEPSLSGTGVARVQRLLASGGGIIVVRTGQRLHEACELIESAGGRVGLG